MFGFWGNEDTVQVLRRAGPPVGGCTQGSEAGLRRGYFGFGVGLGVGGSALRHPPARPGAASVDSGGTQRLIRPRPGKGFRKWPHLIRHGSI